MPEISALIKSVDQLNASNEALAKDVGELRIVVAEFEKVYLPKSEADRRSNFVKVALALLLAGGLTVAGVLNAINSKFEERCQQNRSTMRDVINIAVADRQPLTSSTPETIAAIEQANRTQVRPLRDKLLALPGTQPDKC